MNTEVRTTMDTAYGILRETGWQSVWTRRRPLTLAEEVEQAACIGVWMMLDALARP